MEKIYENALAHELRKSGLHVEQQVAIKVWYDGIIVGEYVADLIVAGVVFVELKAIQALIKFMPPSASIVWWLPSCLYACSSTSVSVLT